MSFWSSCEILQSRLGLKKKHQIKMNFWAVLKVIYKRVSSHPKIWHAKMWHFQNSDMQKCDTFKNLTCKNVTLSKIWHAKMWRFEKFDIQKSDTRNWRICHERLWQKCEPQNSDTQTIS